MFSLADAARTTRGDVAGSAASPANRAIAAEALTVLLRQGGMAQAVALVAATAQQPDDPVPIYRLAIACNRAGAVRLSAALVDMAVAREHRSPEAVYLRGTAKLARGDWSGWKDREARHQKASYERIRSHSAKRMAWTKPRYTGVEDLGGQTLLVCTEQGFGDAIQMLRFVPWLARRTGTLVLQVRHPLGTLVRHNSSCWANVVVIDDREASPSYDYYTWCMSLPSLFNELPPFVPLRALLSPPKEKSRQRRRLGLCWAGNTDYYDDRSRSVPLAAFRSLLDRADIEWYSLQVGPRTAEADGVPTLCQPNTPFATFGDTANAIVDLDGVVTCDTAVCHLAGCLDIPTFTLLPTAPSWRWGPADTTPWYPSMRLLRQRRPDDWPDVIARLERQLDHWVAGLRP